MGHYSPRALGGTVTCTTANYYIQESSNNSTWTNIASGSTSTKRYLRVFEIRDYTITAYQATLAGQTRYWTTFYNPNFNCQLPAGAQAFTMKDDHALYRVGDGSIIPANCAVVIIADTAELTLTSTDSSATPESGNILLGVSADTKASTLLTPAVPGSNLYLTAVYVLSRDSDGNFGFFKFSGTIPANKAYYVE